MMQINIVSINTVQYHKYIFFYDFLNNVLSLAYFIEQI